MSRRCVTHHHACDCREKKFRRIESERDALRKRVEQLEGALGNLHKWCKAYPEDVFIEPIDAEWERIRDVLNYNGLSLDAISASNMRHVVNKWRDLIEQALKGEEVESE